MSSPLWGGGGDTSAQSDAAHLQEKMEEWLTSWPADEEQMEVCKQRGRHVTENDSWSCAVFFQFDEVNIA